MFDNYSKLIKKRSNNVVTTKKQSVFFSKVFSYEMKSLSSTKERNEIKI